MKKGLIYIAILACLPSLVQAQTTGRRPFFGIQMETVTDDTKRILELPEVKGVLISRVIPGSTAERSGLKKGDVLLKINDQEINSPGDGTVYVASQTSGSKFTYEIIRDKKVIKGKNTFVSFPEEKYPGLDVVYSGITSKVGWERMILTRPANNKGKMPVVVFLTGIGCYSLDSPFDTTKPELQLLSKISRAGYVCVRVEKPGMGDNVGKSKKCSEISFNDEVDMYTQAVKELKKRADVDSNSVYLFGHSMGGVIAPMVAKQTAIKGIMAYGTIGSNFIDYLNRTRRTIAEAYNMQPDSTDMLIKDVCECAAYYFIDKLTTEQATAKKAGCKDYLSVFDYRSRAYNDEMYAVDIPGEWKAYTGKALLMWGEGDYISSKVDNQLVAETVNYYHRGHAEFLELPNINHGMQQAADFVQARTSPGAYNPIIAEKVLEWLHTS
jgi:pimeloyl-ACP methyl ester carboxylesterase